MMKTNLFKSISIITDDFISKNDNSFTLSPRGSNILLFSIIDNIQKRYGIKFEIYQPGVEDLKIEFRGMIVNIVKSRDFLDFKNELRSIHFNSNVIHYNNIDLFNGKIHNSYVTTTIHTNAFLEKEEAKKWLKDSIKEIDEVVVVNTQYVKEFGDVKLIKNGIPEKIFEYCLDKRRISPQIDILFPNLNTTKKNREFAIDLIRELNKKKKYKFKLVLTGEEEELLLKNEEYEFVGKKNWGKEMNMLYRNSFITIIPSLTESCSLCALESMSSGTVVIANSIFGISDYIENNFNGYLIDVNNIEGWIERIFTLIEEPKEYLRIQQNARNTVIKEYNLERMSNEYYSMWLRLFERKNG
ncbi:TPA: hypothetical protein DCZ77_01190 [Patescibacteria group bacterium]|nr:MAG: group 1 glycosyl transferase [candidate division WS6 bacterium GW2011_GWF1_33_233]HBB64575.1 hypothetical protein [Patescibacteria group bacterium]